MIKSHVIYGNQIAAALYSWSPLVEKYSMLNKVLCGVMLAALTGCSAFATYTYSDKITKDNFVQIMQLDQSAPDLHDNDDDQRAFHAGLQRYGDKVIGKTLGQVVHDEKSAEQADNNKALAKMDPEDRQVLLDTACQEVQTALMQEGQIEAGCTWDFPNGKGAPAAIVLHLFPAELDRSGLSKDDVRNTAELMLERQAVHNSVRVYSTKVNSILMN